MSHDELINGALQHNMEIAVAKGPGIRTSYITPVIARDRQRGYVRLGGLGAFGLGSMWFPDRKQEYVEYPGYAEAPEEDSRGQLGGPLPEVPGEQHDTEKQNGTLP